MEIPVDIKLGADGLALIDLRHNEIALSRARLRFGYFALTGTWLAVIACVALVVFGCAHTPCTIAEPASFTNDQQMEAAVRVEVACMGGDPSKDDFAVHVQTGSGVVVGPYDVLTAGHVVRCPPVNVAYIGLRGRDGVRRQAIIDRADWWHDIARLRVIGAPYYGARVPPIARAVRGDVCIATAYPERDGSCGEITVVRPERIASGDFAVEVDILSTAPVIPGNSGSAMWDARGRLVAIATHAVGWCFLGRSSLCSSRATSVLDRGMMP